MKIQIELKYDWNNEYLNEDQYTFFIIFHSVILRMRWVRIKVVKIIKTHFMLNNFFSKVVPFVS